MDKSPNPRRDLLVKLESIIGAECYNGNIENYGPGGYREAPGRSIRYPLMVRKNDGTKEKIRADSVPDTVSDEELRSGYYAFGANHLDVISALEKIVKHLERHHGLKISPQSGA